MSTFRLSTMVFLEGCKRNMKHLIIWELKRLFSKKYLLIMTFLLISLNVYIICYEYDEYLNYAYLQENINEVLIDIEGNITNEKTVNAERKHTETLQLLDLDFESEEEGAQVNLQRYFYAAYFDYLEVTPFPMEYGGEVYESKQDIVNTLKQHEKDSSTYAALHKYVSLVDKIEREKFYVMHYWKEIFQQHSLLFLMVTLIIAMSAVFGEDYSRNVASLTLSATYGKTKLVKARIVAGALFAFCIYFSFYIVELITKFSLHGLNGYQGNVSILGFLYLPNETPLTILTIFTLFTIFASICLTFLTLAISLYTKRTIVTMITMVIVIFSVESIKIPFIENFSLRQIVNNFTNSFSTYDPILFGPNLLSRPLYLLISLLFITIISLIVILFKGKRQQI